MVTDAAALDPILGPDDPPPFSVYNEKGRLDCLIVADHCSNLVPDKLNQLGLSDTSLLQHYAYDIGTEHLVKAVADLLNAPAIMAGYSRLVVDVNRDLSHDTLFSTQAFDPDQGVINIPGNKDLTEEQRQQRIDAFYMPYDDAIRRHIDSVFLKGIIPVVISIHSFTRYFYKIQRPWDLGVLWAQDNRLVEPITSFFEERRFNVGHNQPYDYRFVSGSTTIRHAESRRLPSVTLEFCNDRINTKSKAEYWGEMLYQSLNDKINDEAIHSLYEGPLFSHDIDKEKNYFQDLIENAKEGKILNE